MTQVEVAATLGMSRRGVYARLRRVEALAARMGETVPVAPDQPRARAAGGGEA